MATRTRRIPLIWTLVVLSGALPLQAGTMHLAWDPVVHPALAGYRLYYQPVAGGAAATLDVGPVTEAVLPALADCTEYSVRVKAVDSLGGVSPEFSNHVFGWARPQVTAVEPSVVEARSQATLVITGVNFRDGSTVQFGDPAITVLGTVVTGCGSLLVEVALGDAVPGPRTIRVVGPDTVFGETAGLLQVVADESAPQIEGVAVSAIGATTATVSWHTNEPTDGRVRYRRVGESGYRVEEDDASEATEHAVALMGLDPDTTYEFYVESEDAAGHAATSALSTWTTLESESAYLRIEAETALLEAPLATRTGQDAFSRGWIELPAGSPGGSISNPAGTARVGFHVPHDGEWRVWLRLHTGAAQARGWFERVDGAIDQAVVPTVHGQWTWVAARTYTLAAGQHTLVLGGRDAGARADRVIVTGDVEFVPSEAPGPDLDAPAPVAQLQAQRWDGSIALAWTHPTEAQPFRVVVRVRTDGVFPANPADGVPLLDAEGTSGAPGTYDHAGTVGGTAYSYSIFTIDEEGNASAAATVEVPVSIGPLGVVQNLRRTDVRP